MKKAVILVSCALLSAPLFAKGMSHHFIKKSQHQVVSSSVNHPDISGHWVSRCEEMDDTNVITMDLKQNETKFSMKLKFVGDFADIVFNQKFELGNFKVDTKSSPGASVHSFGYAEWWGENTLFLNFKQLSLTWDLDNNNKGLFETTLDELMLTKEGEKLTVKFRDYNSPNDSISCSFHKEG